MKIIAKVDTFTTGPTEPSGTEFPLGGRTADNLLLSRDERYNDTQNQTSFPKKYFDNLSKKYFDEVVWTQIQRSTDAIS